MCLFVTVKRLSKSGVKLLKLFSDSNGRWHLHVLEFPNANNVVSVTSVQSQTVGRPAERSALRWSGVFAVVFAGDLDLELFDQGLLFEIPDLDGGSAGGAEPVSVWREDKSGDFIATVQAVQWVLGGVTEVPKFGLTVLASGGGEGSVRGDSHGVDVTGVAAEFGLELEVGQVPDFDSFVPTAGDDHWIGSGRAEFDIGDPFRVGVFTFLRPLELAEGVPKLDGLIATGRNDLTVVGGERNGKHVVFVTDEAGAGGTLFEVPQAEGVVPGAGDAELTAG